MTTLTPERSLEQRREGLRLANLIRSRRSELKHDLKAGDVGLHSLLNRRPIWTDTMRVYDLLLATPGLGRVKTNRVMNQCRISPSKTLGGLTQRQVKELICELDHKGLL